MINLESNGLLQFMQYLWALIIPFIYRIYKDLNAHKLHTSETYAKKDDMKEMAEDIKTISRQTNRIVGHLEAGKK